MKTTYKHIHFEEDTAIGQKAFYWCKKNKTKTILGCVSYYPPWKRYVFEAHTDAIFDASCHTDIAHFLTQFRGEKK